jgi:hypothetical protein
MSTRREGIATTRYHKAVPSFQSSPIAHQKAANLSLPPHGETDGAVEEIGAPANGRRGIAPAIFGVMTLGEVGWCAPRMPGPGFHQVSAKELEDARICGNLAADIERNSRDLIEYTTVYPTAQRPGETTWRLQRG